MSWRKATFRSPSERSPNRHQSNENPINIRRGEWGVDGNAIRGMVCRVGLYGRPPCLPTVSLIQAMWPTRATMKAHSTHPPDHSRPYGILDVRFRLMPIGRRLRSSSRHSWGR